MIASDNLALALVHYPVYNKHREVVTTAVTNLDIHDISRAARTYGLNRYYLVTPSPDQQTMVHKIVGHWQTGWGATYNPDRRDALQIIRLVEGLEQARDDFQQGFSAPVRTIVTGARKRPDSISYADLRCRLQQPQSPHLLVLGTGWGLTDELFNQVGTAALDPICGTGSYNHLSVRSAAAIMLDRLLGA